MNTSSSFIKGKIFSRSKPYPNQIFPHNINLYNEKLDWLFIVDPIWLVWNTYISHSLTDSLTHPRPITNSTRRLRGIFFYKKITQKNSFFHMSLYELFVWEDLSTIWMPSFKILAHYSLLSNVHNVDFSTCIYSCMPNKIILSDL